MKIQINITESTKEVIVEESCNLKELATFMQVSFPNDYPDFKIVPKVITNFSSPIYVDPYTLPYWRQPWYQYKYRTLSSLDYVGSAGTLPNFNNGTSTTPGLVQGTYNVEAIFRENTYNAGTDSFKQEDSAVSPTGETFVYKKEDNL